MESILTSIEERVLILAPTGRDAQLIASTLEQGGMQPAIFRNVACLRDAIVEGAGAVILTEEALRNSGLEVLEHALGMQPPWSDLPVIILTTGGEARSAVTWALVQRLEHAGNVSLLERPLRPMTLLSAVHVALRARRRQYEVRSLHERLERRVKERTAELQRLNEEAEGFNYSISHDLRSPLRTINATSQILLTEHSDKLGDEARFLLERQALAAQRLAGLIDDLLRLSRLSRQEMSTQEFDLTALASEIVAELRSQRECRCAFTIQPGMRANGDPILVRFVLWNLLENACKFSPQGGNVFVGEEDGHVYYVKDEGIGFDPRFVAKVFLPFERLVTDAEFPGSGIGLANVRRIVERHGGKVWADSKPGCGATFFFTL